MKNYIGDLLYKKEKAEEDIYFAKRDQMLIKNYRRKQAQKEKKSSASNDKLTTDSDLTEVSDTV